MSPVRPITSAQTSEDEVMAENAHNKSDEDNSSSVVGDEDEEIIAIAMQDDQIWMNLFVTYVIKVEKNKYSYTGSSGTRRN